MIRKGYLYLAITLISCVVSLMAAPSLHAQGSSKDWASYNRTWAGDRFSALREITRKNAGGLREICTAEIPETKSLNAGPLAIDGTVYLTTDTETYAFDGSACALRWRHSHPYTPHSFLGGNRGAAYLDGRLFRGAGDGHVFAIDAAKGTSLWDVPIADASKGESVPMAPIAWNGMVLVGNAGGDNFGVTGRVYALSAADGHVLWEFRSVPDTPEVKASWPNASAANPPTGGAFWTSFSLDAINGVLYVSAGNPAPDFMEAMRPGANLYTNAIIALDARTGKLLGYNQPIRNDFHDWDISAAPAIITTRGGKHLALAASKDAYLHAVDLNAINASGGESAAHHGVIYSAPTATHFNVNQPLSDKRDTRFCPGSQGGSEWNGAAYHPQLNLAFVPTTDWCTTVRLVPLDQMKGKPGEPWTGSPLPAAFGKQDPKEQWKGWVTAVNADSGAVIWKFKAPTPILAGVTPTAGNVVFAADLNGTVYAFDAATGRRLWKGDAGAPASGGVISYEAGGHQRIGVAAGMKSPIWPVKTAGPRFVVFGLP